MKNKDIIEIADDVSEWVSESLLTEDGIEENPDLVSSLMKAYSGNDKPKTNKTDKQKIKAIAELIGGGA